MNLSSSQSSSSSAHTTPFVQQSPPPRRKLSQGSSTLILSSSSAALKKPAINHQQSRSPILLQWRAGASLIQPHSPHDQPSTLITGPQHFQSLAHSASTAKINDIFNSTNISSATTTKEQQPKKLSSIANILRSHSISSSSDHSSASSASSFSSSSSAPSVVSPSSQVDFGRNGLHASPSGYIGSNPTPSNSDHSILETSCPPPTHVTKFSSSSSSFHHSISQSTTDSEFESSEHEDYEQEILSPTSKSQLFPNSSINTPTPSPGPRSNSTSASNASHHLPSASHSFISDHHQHHHPHLRSPSSSSHISHTSPTSVTDLPFACPSPIVPSRRLKNRPTRPVPTRAPPLPRSQTPSLLIRPKFSPCSNLDLAIQSVPFHSNLNVHSNVSIDPRVDIQKRPVSGSKIDMIRDLGWGPGPTNPTYIAPPPHLACPSTSSIDLTTELLTPHRSPGSAQISSTAILSIGPTGSSSPPSQVNILRSKTKKFRDRFTLTGTAPLKISKRQKTHHTDNLPSTSDAGRRIVSGLLNALSPTNATHVISDPVNERRKAEFKKKISYPVLNHASGDDTLSHCGNEEHHDDDTDCYNLTIEAAVRSLEGIRSNGSSPRNTRQVPSNTSLSNQRRDVPSAPGRLDKNFDSSTLEAQSDDIILDEMSQVWSRKLRKRISGKRLLAKTNRNQVGDDRFELDGQSAAGPLQQVKGTHKQLKSKAGARLKPLLHRVSSLSIKQRAYFSENETGTIFEPSKSSQKGCIIVDKHCEEEELALPTEHFDTRSNWDLHSELKLDSRFRWIRSSISKKKIPRSVPSSTTDMLTPKRQQNRPVIKSSQSIREKRKIFEPEDNYQFNESLPDLPTMSTSLLSASLTPVDQSALMDSRLSNGPLAIKRSSMLSQRQLPSRKPTPAEIKLKDEARSVKALVNKFEHQSHKTLPRSAGSDYLTDVTSERGRVSSIGFVRNSLTSVWSGGGSNISKNLSSTRSSKQLARDQRRERRGWSSGNNFSDTSECAPEAETIPIQKLKKKKKKKHKTWSKSLFQNDDSSFSSFGCDLQERDEEDYETGPISDNTELSECSYHLLSTSSIRRSRWTCSNGSSREVSAKDSEENPVNVKHQRSQSSPNDINVGFDSLGYVDDEHQVGADYELQASSDKQLSEPENSNENKTWSLVSSEQAQTVLEPQTVWMGDGSERKILVAGGRLQMAKKIPFPSFEDDAEFSQPVNLQLNVSTTKEPLSSKPIYNIVEQNKQSNRLSSFIRTRKFDHHELDDDEDGINDQTDDHCIQLGSKLTEEDLGSRMMCATDIVSLQDSPTHGRGRRSLQKSMLMNASERSHLESPDRPRSIPRLLLDPTSDIGQKDQQQHNSSCNESPNSILMKRMCLSVDRCQGLGSKMLGSSISIQQRPSVPSSSRCSGRRSASTVVSCALFRLSPITSRPRSQPPMSTSAVTIFNGFETVDSVQLLPPRSPLISTFSRSSILGCDILEQAQNDNSAAITGLTDSREGVSASQQYNISDIIISSAQLDLEAPQSVTNVKFDELANFDRDTMDANEALKFELARLQRVQEEWRKFCLEVEDVLKKSRERWPDQVEPDKVLGEFRRPTTKSTFEAFLASSQRLHKSRSVQTIKSTRLPQYSSDVISQLTPPSKHPFNSRPITPSTVAGYPSLNDNDRHTQGSPLVVTLPVPSAFVSPERFLGGGKIPKIESERGSRVIKISNRSRQLGLRQHTLSNRLAGAGFKPATDRHRTARMISVTSSTGSFNSSGKAVLAERSVNQSPVTFRDPIQHSDEISKISSSPKIGSDQTTKLIGSPGVMNRPSIGKWARENEGSQWTSVSMRETRKPWRRSILNPTTRSHGSQDGLRKSSFASNTSSEEVGVLVAAGDQPHEFEDGFHTSGSLRVKHRRRLNQARSDRSIGTGAQRIHLKPSETELGVPSTGVCKKASFRATHKQSSENKSSISNHLELNKKKSQITITPITHHRI